MTSSPTILLVAERMTDSPRRICVSGASPISSARHSARAETLLLEPSPRRQRLECARQAGFRATPLFPRPGLLKAESRKLKVEIDPFSSSFSLAFSLSAFSFSPPTSSPISLPVSPCLCVKISVFSFSPPTPSPISLPVSPCLCASVPLCENLSFPFSAFRFQFSAFLYPHTLFTLSFSLAAGP